MSSYKLKVRSFVDIERPNRSNMSARRTVRTFQKDLLIIWVFPNIGVLQNGWFIMENPIKMYPYFWKRPYVRTFLVRNKAPDL